MRFLYSLGYYLAFPGLLVRLLWRSRHHAGYRHRWGERFGYIPRVTEGRESIWIHAVSVGETLAALPLIRELKVRYPKYNIVVTTTTPTGSDLVRKHLGDDVMHVYTPYDVSASVNRFIRRTRTRFCIIMEIELWPNTLQCCRQHRIPVMLANARMSERSTRRYKIIRRITKSMLKSCSMVAAQGLLDGERLIELGLNPKRLMISGNIKFDLDMSDDVIESGRNLRKSWGTTERPTLIAASTHEGEEEILLNAFAQIRRRINDALLIIVPRHPSRCERIRKLCTDGGYRSVLRSEQGQPSTESEIMIVDTMGELRTLYGTCDIAFVGGSLVPTGGHNLIEPAILGLPVLTGPNLQNFTDISTILKDAGAAQIVHDAKSTANTVIALFSAQDLRERMGQRAREVITANTGSLQKHLDWIENNFPPARRLTQRY